jgi:hypothetical protein
MVNLSPLDTVLRGPLKLCLLAPSSVFGDSKKLLSLSRVSSKLNDGKTDGPNC